MTQWDLEKLNKKKLLDPLINAITETQVFCYVLLFTYPVTFYNSFPSVLSTNYC